MVFKIVEKSCGSTGIEPMEISINNYGISFGTEIAKKLDGFSHCEVYLDKETRRVGLKPTINCVTGYKIATAKDDGRKSLTGGWAKRLPNKRIVAKIEEDFIILNDCEIADKKSKA